MGLIKSNNAPASLQPFSLADIERQAAMILLRAKKQAERVLVEVQKESDELRRQARAEGLAGGYDEGLGKGLEEGRLRGHEQALTEHRAQLTEVLGALITAATELNAQRRELEAAAVTQVIELAVAIADRITKRQGELRPSVVTANVAEALRLVMHAADLRIAVHPRQKAVLEEALPQLRIEFPVLEHAELISDAALAPGGCRVFTREGLVDADLDEQLRRIAKELVPGDPTPAATAATAAEGA